jgi:hypothetical protein
MDKPDASSFFPILGQHNVVSSFWSPTPLRIIRQNDPDDVHSRHSSSPQVPSSTERQHYPLPRRASEYGETFHYNLPLNECFHHEKILNEEEL